MCRAKVNGLSVHPAVSALQADLPVFNVRTLDAHVETNLVFRKIRMKTANWDLTARDEQDAVIGRRMGGRVDRDDLAAIDQHQPVGYRDFVPEFVQTVLAREKNEALDYT